MAYFVIWFHILTYNNYSLKYMRIFTFKLHKIIHVKIQTHSHTANYKGPFLQLTNAHFNYCYYWLFFLIFLLILNKKNKQMSSLVGCLSVCLYFFIYWFIKCLNDWIVMIILRTFYACLIFNRDSFDSWRQQFQWHKIYKKKNNIFYVLTN